MLAVPPISVEVGSQRQHLIHLASQLDAITLQLRHAELEKDLLLRERKLLIHNIEVRVELIC
jgi:hypothetical protein